MTNSTSKTRKGKYGKGNYDSMGVQKSLGTHLAALREFVGYYTVADSLLNRT
jgi:hypothetical protein